MDRAVESRPSASESRVDRLEYPLLDAGTEARVCAREPRVESLEKLAAELPVVAIVELE
jgi:hypothetical protein